MCFRPAEADSGVHPVKCAKCGKRVFPTEGLLPKKCPFCKEDLVDADNAPAAGAPSAPGAPQPPSAPGAPQPPSAPGAPKPPVA